MASPNTPSAASLINSSSNSPDFSNLEEGKTQTLTDIAELQNLELDYFNQLNQGLTDNSLSQPEKDILTQRINEISQMRINLYKGLNQTYNFFNANVTMSRNTMDEQSAAIQIVENELNEAKRRLKIIQEEKDNKVRLVEISTYYGEKYSDHSDIMKIVIATCIPILILTFFRNRGLLKDSIYAILFILVGVIGLLVLLRHLYNSYHRDNMYYDEYDWTFTPPSNVTATTSKVSDPWNNGGGSGDGCLASQLDNLTGSVTNMANTMTGGN